MSKTAEKSAAPPCTRLVTFFARGRVRDSNRRPTGGYRLAGSPGPVEHGGDPALAPRGAGGARAVSSSPWSPPILSCAGESGAPGGPDGGRKTSRQAAEAGWGPGLFTPRRTWGCTFPCSCARRRPPTRTPPESPPARQSRWPDAIEAVLGGESRRQVGQWNLMPRGQKDLRHPDGAGGRGGDRGAWSNLIVGAGRQRESEPPPTFRRSCGQNATSIPRVQRGGRRPRAAGRAR